MRLKALLLIAPFVALTGCASLAEQAGLKASAVAGAVDRPSNYGLFLAGQAALNKGESVQASSYFNRAGAGDLDRDLIQDHTFTATLMSGDIAKAAQIAPTGDGVSMPLVRLGALVKAVDEMATGKGKEAHVLLTGDQIGFPHGAAASLLAPWAAAQAGDAEGSLVAAQARNDRVVAMFGQLSQGYLYERAKRFDEAETNFKTLAASQAGGLIFPIAYGGFLERRGRRDEAVTVYDEGLARSPDDLALKAARTRALAKKAPPPAPTLRQGAAQALLASAVNMISARQEQLGQVYLRLVLRLDPDRNEAWLMLGDLMQQTGDLAAAREAYGHPKPGSLEYPRARAQLAWTYQAGKDTETALKLAREAVASGGMDAKLVLADLLRANEKYPEALALMDEVVAATPDPDWRLLYSRAVVLQKQDRWPDAERDLLAALKARPEEPELLNYLGYSWIDRGERLDEAMGMVKKAVAANPQSGAMIDSLGWAYYRLGDLPKAVSNLERAVELEPGDPEINNHLGDAYWRIGRRVEAQFQWRRVLTLEPDERIKADAAAKLKGGLGPDGPAPTPKLAGQ